MSGLNSTVSMLVPERTQLSEVHLLQKQLLTKAYLVWVLFHKRYPPWNPEGFTERTGISAHLQLGSMLPDKGRMRFAG